MNKHLAPQVVCNQACGMLILSMSRVYARVERRDQPAHHGWLRTGTALTHVGDSPKIRHPGAMITQHCEIEKSFNLLESCELSWHVDCDDTCGQRRASGSSVFAIDTRATEYFHWTNDRRLGIFKRGVVSVPLQRDLFLYVLIRAHCAANPLQNFLLRKRLSPPSAEEHRRLGHLFQTVMFSRFLLRINIQQQQGNKLI